MSESTGPAPDEGVDVQQLLSEGHQTFLGLTLLCGQGALVPRPETEILGRAAIEKLTIIGQSVRVIDMCCGAGNLACAIAVHVPGAHVWASDLTDGCVLWTRRNVDQLGLGERVTVAQGDLFAGLEEFELHGGVDMIVCNPPYISTSRLEGDRASLLDHEPREAFDGGPYGLAIHQRVVSEAPRFLKPGGWLLMEFGLGQHRQVKVLVDRTRRYTDLAFMNDADGAPRVAVARLRA